MRSFVAEEDSVGVSPFWGSLEEDMNWAGIAPEKIEPSASFMDVELRQGYDNQGRVFIKSL